MPPFFDVRMKGFRDRKTVAEVVALLQSRVTPNAPKRTWPRLGLTLSAPVVSPVNVPGFARAAMDGYAVRGEDTFGAEPNNPVPLTVIGSALPGVPFDGTVGAGQGVRIMTGAPLPAGADAVLPVELTVAHGGSVSATEAVAPGRHVGRIGEDVREGQEVLRAGRVLRPQDIGMLSAIGVSEVAAVGTPTVGILTTGNELLPPFSVPVGFQITDANTPMLEALVWRDGGQILPTIRVEDQHDAVRDAIKNCAADVILISGGSSVGAEDHAPRAVAELGELLVHGVALRPASPTGFGIVDDKFVFLLPGNPVSCLCAYDLFAGPVIRRIGGRPWKMPYRTAELPTGSKIVSAVGRMDYVRVKVVGGLVEPLAVSGASILSTTVFADGFVLIDPDSEGVPAGGTAVVHFYD
jgi:molybdopterin molybdotransferase